VFLSSVLRSFKSVRGSSPPHRRYRASTTRVRASRRATRTTRCRPRATGTARRSSTPFYEQVRAISDARQFCVRRIAPTDYHATPACLRRTSNTTISARQCCARGIPPPPKSPHSASSSFQTLVSSRPRPRGRAHFVSSHRAQVRAFGLPVGPLGSARAASSAVRRQRLPRERRARRRLLRLARLPGRAAEPSAVSSRRGLRAIDAGQRLPRRGHLLQQPGRGSAPGPWPCTNPQRDSRSAGSVCGQLPSMK
jgi:hypothetical protein